MSWIEPAGEGHAVRFATLEGDAWSAPSTIVERTGMFVNWADFPSLVALEDGTLVAHWLVRNGGRGTAYDVHISRSTDGGASWSEPVIPHGDGTATEHGFVSLVPEAGGGFTAIWLDGRDFAGREPGAGGHGPPAAEMSLRGATFDARGEVGEEFLLDARICDCCQTSAVRIGSEILAVYRDRSAEEIRDIYAVTRGAGGWTDPAPVARDGWQIPGCPVNGPAVAARGGRAAVAWFALREGIPEVKVAFTEDAGRSFGEPILVHGGDRPVEPGPAREPADGAAPTGRGPGAGADDPFVPLGRVDVEWLDGRTVAVTWLAGQGGRGEIRVLPVTVEGGAGEPLVAATTRADRSSGFPRTARAGDRMVMAWTEPGEPARVHTAILPVVTR